jgi:hypothetical protein
MNVTVSIVDKEGVTLGVQLLSLPQIPPRGVRELIAKPVSYLEPGKRIRVRTSLPYGIETDDVSKVGVDESLVLYLALDEGNGNVTYDSSSYENNGSLYGSIVDEFEDGDYTSNPVWTLDCGGIPVGDIVPGYKSDYAFRINSTGGDGLACAITPYDAVVNTMITYVYKGSRGAMCIWNGTTCINSPVTCGWYAEDWRICRTNITRTQSGVNMYVYNNGTIGAWSIYDFITEGPAWSGGKIGNALSFDGTDDYVETVQSLDLNLLTSAFTFEAWVKPHYRTVDPTYASWVIAAKFAAIGMSIAPLSTTHFGVKPWVDGNAGVHGSFTFDEWHHIAVVYTGFGSSERKVYVDGEYIATDVGGTAADFSGKVRIGDNPYVSVSYGTIDEVRIYNRALSEAEIKASYSS